MNSNRVWRVFVAVGIIVIIVLLLGVLLRLSGRRLFPRKKVEQSPKEQATPRLNENEFNKKLNEGAKQPTDAKRNLLFSGHLNMASEENVIYIEQDAGYLDSTLQMLDVLEEAGVDII